MSLTRALAAAPRAPAPDSEPGVPAFLHALLRQVEPFPAAVLSARWDILAFNRSYDALFSLESVPARNRNAMLLYFTDPGLRELWPDWAADAPRVVSQFRAAMARHGADPEWATLLERLRQASPDFDRLWQQAEAGDYDTRTGALPAPGGRACCGWPASTCGPSRAKTASSRSVTRPPTSRPRPSCTRLQALSTAGPTKA